MSWWMHVVPSAYKFSVCRIVDSKEVLVSVSCVMGMCRGMQAHVDQLSIL